MHRPFHLRHRGRGRLDPDRRGAGAPGHRGPAWITIVRWITGSHGRIVAGLDRRDALHDRRARPQRRPDRARASAALEQSLGCGSLHRRGEPGAADRAQLRAARRVCCCGATSTTSCATAASSWSTSSPAAWSRTGTGPTACRPPLEAKEGVARAIRRDASSARSRCSTSCGSIPRLCGMTATARPAAEELQEFYGLTTCRDPARTGPASARDLPDLVFTPPGGQAPALVARDRASPRHRAAGAGGHRQRGGVGAAGRCAAKRGIGCDGAQRQDTTSGRPRIIAEAGTRRAR